MEVQTKAIAEYLGMFKAEHMNKHGNAKITKQEYIRTSPITKNQIISEIKTGKPVRQIFSEKFQSEHQPRDSKFVHNVKYVISKENAYGNRQKSADDVQNVINMLSKSHPFLKEIVQSAGKLPNVICHTDYQMKHLSSACKTSVISVDKTFNLGACFVTTVFQESKLKRKGKNTNPFILGPVYLHLGWCFSYIPKIFHSSGVCFRYWNIRYIIELY
jgi:hypothetical protein